MVLVSTSQSKNKTLVSIDDVRVYGRGLTEEESITLFNLADNSVVLLDYDLFEDGLLDPNIWSQPYKDNSITTYGITEELGYLYAQPEAIAKRWIHSTGENAIDWKTLPDGSEIFFDVSTF